MPVIGAIAIFEGASALAAGVEGLAAVSAIGGIVGGIGMVTGNKQMAMLGGAAALAGGIGAFAQGKGWLADAGPLADPGSNITALKNTAAPITEGQVGAGTAGAPTIGADTSMDTGSIAKGIGQAATQGGGTGGLMEAQEPGWTSATAPTIAGGGSVTGTGEMSGIPKGDWGPDGPPGMRTPAPGATPGRSGVMGTLKDFSDWANNNKTLASMLGNFIGGAFDAEKKAKTSFYNAQTDQLRQQTENMRSVPNMNLRSSGPVVFPSTAPTYTPVRIAGGLYGAH